MFRRFPRPQLLVKRGWHAAELERIIAYLRSGQVIACCGGWSTCRFPRCREGERNGACEFTDGTWAWPEGLAHYVERHSVMLPEEFVETMRANEWRVPSIPEGQDTLLEKSRFDFTYWLEWARQHQRRPWYAPWPRGPRVGEYWLPGHWDRTKPRWVWIPGHWNRGRRSSDHRGAQ